MHLVRTLLGSVPFFFLFLWRRWGGGGGGSRVFVFYKGKEAAKVGQLLFHGKLPLMVPSRERTQCKPVCTCNDNKECPLHYIIKLNASCNKNKETVP